MRDNVNLTLVDSHTRVIADVFGRIQVGTINDGVIQTIHSNACGTCINISRISTGIAMNVCGILAVAVSRSIHDEAQTVDSCLNILFDFLRSTGISSAVFDGQTLRLERVTVGVGNSLRQNANNILLTANLGILNTSACGNLLTSLSSGDCLIVPDDSRRTAAIKRAGTAVVYGVFLTVANLQIQVRHVKVCIHDGLCDLLILAQRIIHVLNGFPVINCIQFLSATRDHRIKNRVFLVSLPCLACKTEVVCSSQNFIFTAYKGVSRIDKCLCCFTDAASGRSFAGSAGACTSIRGSTVCVGSGRFRPRLTCSLRRNIARHRSVAGRGTCCVGNIAFRRGSSSGRVGVCCRSAECISFLRSFFTLRDSTRALHCISSDRSKLRQAHCYGDNRTQKPLTRFLHVSCPPNNVSVLWFYHSRIYIHPYLLPSVQPRL